MHETKRVVIAALAANAAIAATKFGAALFTGSAAMFSEGVHSVVDTGNEALLLLGLVRSERKPTPRYPLGHSREIYFWSFMVAVFIFGAGAVVSLVEGIENLTTPHQIEDPLVNYIVLALALVFEGVSWVISFRAFRRSVPDGRGYLRAIHRSKDPANFIVLLEDSAAIAGLLIAGLGVFLSTYLTVPAIDAAASIAIAVVLGVVAVYLAYECMGLLIGESAAPETVEQIRRIISADPRIEQLRDLITVHIGPDDVVMAAEVDFCNDLTGAGVEDTVSALDQKIRREFPEITRTFIKPVGKAKAFSAAK
jgi:cation diffusion facilitator family transporter